MKKRNIVNPDELAEAIDRFLADGDLDEHEQAEPLRRLLRRAVISNKLSWKRVRKRRRKDPQWIATRLEEGVKLHRFGRIGPRTGWQWRRFMRALQDIEELANGSEPALDRTTADARRFIAKLGRGELEDHIDRAEKILSGAETERLKARFTEDVVAAAEVEATNGARWTRLRSLKELHETGRRFGNCLARSSCGHHEDYWQKLLDGTMQFWVLHLAAGTPGCSGGVVIASVDCTTQSLQELEGRDGDMPSTRYRRDVALLIRDRDVDVDTRHGVYVPQIGLVPDAIAQPDDAPSPSIHGRIGDMAWRVFAYPRSLLVEAGDEDEFVTFDMRWKTEPRCLADIHRGGAMPITRLADILTRYAGKQDEIDPPLGRVLALILREKLDAERPNCDHDPYDQRPMELDL